MLKLKVKKEKKSKDRKINILKIKNAFDKISTFPLIKMEVPFFFGVSSF